MMAIRFVDVEPGKGGSEGAKPAPAHRAGVPESSPEPAPPPEASPTEEVSADGAAPHPDLPHAKPEPKPRGRKKPMAPARAEKPAPAAPDDASAPLLAGLLPELQVHAKPAPKPRGRRKAFG